MKKYSDLYCFVGEFVVSFKKRRKEINMKRFQKSSDMTEGGIACQLLFFAFPIMFSSLFHLIYSLADSIIVGKFIGGNALAAVSVTGNATYLLFSIAGGVNMGSSVVLAQAYGARDEQRMKQIIATSVWVLGIAAGVFTILGISMTGMILKIIHTPEDIFEMARSYLLIIFAGTAGSIFYDWLAALLRAFGNSFVPLVCLVFSGVLNVLLDLFFILYLDMGIEGAAYATVISQILSGVLCFVYVWKCFPVIRLKKGERGLKKGVLKKILWIGVPAAAQDGIITISNMILQSVLNTYGTIVVLAYSIVSKYELICMQVGDALGNAVSTFVGQNMGAGKMGRVIRSVKTTVFLNFVGYGIVAPVVFFAAKECMSIFTDQGEAIALGVRFLHVYAVFFPALGILILFQNFLRSVGDIPSTIWMGICEVAARTVFALGLPFVLEASGLFFVSPFTWVASMLLGIGCYASGRWKKKKYIF